MPERRPKENNERKPNGPRTVLLAAILLGMALGALTLKGERQAEEIGSGVVTTQEREVADFHSIDSRGAIDVYVSQGDTAAVRVEGEDNLLPYVNTRVNNGVLMIDTRRGRFTVKNPLVVHVTMPEVRELTVSGSGSLIGRTPLAGQSVSLVVTGSGDVSVGGEFERLDCRMTGSGDLTAQGTAERQTVELEGSGTVNTQNLQVSESCLVDSSGSGNCWVWSSGALAVSLDGSGEVRYKGEPSSLESRVDGSGSLGALE